MEPGSIMKQSQTRDNCGFTLLELLIVITVIGVLAALLAPAVSMVRASVSRIQCSNNLRQIGLGLIQYEASHGKLPKFGSSTRLGWAIALLPMIEQDNLSTYWVDSNGDQDRADKKFLFDCPKVYQCPVQNQNKYTATLIPPGHFGFNPHLSSRPLGIIESNSNMVLAAELPLGLDIPWYSSPDLIEGDLGFHHCGTTTIVFGDGHVESPCIAKSANIRIHPDGPN
jgi:prepilin-type N-terminal cleavage/methylation domain-containing protein